MSIFVLQLFQISTQNSHLFLAVHDLFFNLLNLNSLRLQSWLQIKHFKINIIKLHKLLLLYFILDFLFFKFSNQFLIHWLFVSYRSLKFFFSCFNLPEILEEGDTDLNDLSPTGFIRVDYVRKLKSWESSTSKDLSKEFGLINEPEIIIVLSMVW